MAWLGAPRRDADLGVPEPLATKPAGRRGAGLGRGGSTVRPRSRGRLVDDADLADASGAFGLIHGDLHYENVLFHRGEACAIDFDDCGWGFHLYDLVVTLSELERRPRYDELHDALLQSYARPCSLPENHATHLQALSLLCREQLLLWILESREHAAFRGR